MDQQPTGARRTLQIVRRHKRLIAAAVVIGLGGGVGYAAISQKNFSSQALVVLQPAATNPQGTDPTTIAATQALVVTSDPVLSNALASLHSTLPVTTFHSDVSVSSPAPDVLAISATARSATQARDYTNSVVTSYVNYAKENPILVSGLSVQLLQPATTPVPPSPLQTYGFMAILGMLAGAVIGFVVAFAMSRGDRRLRDRGEIANAIGLPVLAAFAIDRAVDPADWARLLAHYEPAVVDGWRLRRVIDQIYTVRPESRLQTDGTSITIVSISSDPKALPLGPQLAIFAASLGIPTTLCIGPQQDTSAVASLRTAGAAYTPGSADRSRYLRVLIPDHDGRVVEPPRGLTVNVAVVDGDGPQILPSMRSTVAILGVSSGTVNAEQLARVATAVTDAGSYILGILLANPEPTDHTTGLDPQLGAPTQRRLPTRLNGMPTEVRR